MYPSELSSSGDDIGKGEGVREWGGEVAMLMIIAIIYDHVSRHLKSYLNFQNLNFDF